jgi:ribosomal silencing factor RsfS
MKKDEVEKLYQEATDPLYQVKIKLNKQLELLRTEYPHLKQEKIDPTHECTQKSQCKFITYAEGDIVMRICKASGKYHLCGKECNALKLYNEKTGAHFCEISNDVVLPENLPNVRALLKRRIAEPNDNCIDLDEDENEARAAGRVHIHEYVHVQDLSMCILCVKFHACGTKCEDWVLIDGERTCRRTGLVLEQQCCHDWDVEITKNKKRKGVPSIHQFKNRKFCCGKIANSDNTFTQDKIQFENSKIKATIELIFSRNRVRSQAKPFFTKLKEKAMKYALEKIRKEKTGGNGFSLMDIDQIMLAHFSKRKYHFYDINFSPELITFYTELIQKMWQEIIMHKITSFKKVPMQTLVFECLYVLKDGVKKGNEYIIPPHAILEYIIPDILFEKKIMNFPPRTLPKFTCGLKRVLLEAHKTDPVKFDEIFEVEDKSLINEFQFDRFDFKEE